MGKPLKIPQPSESDEQIALINWVESRLPTLPQLELLYAVPNGGSRHPATAKRLRAEGVRAGVLDVNLDWPASGYHGLRIEMKRASGGQVSAAQKIWVERYRRAGYRAEVCSGCEEAKSVILEYLRDG